MIVVVGSANMDLVVRGTRLPRPGETVVGGQFYQAHGGKGANQAVAAARAAGRVAFVGAVGDDRFGQQLRESLHEEHIDCRFLVTKPGCATGVAVIMVDDQGQNAISVAPGANAALTRDDVDRAADVLFGEARVVLVSWEIPVAVAERALERAVQAGAITVLNPAPAHPHPTAHAAFRYVDWLTPNELEACLLAERPGAGPVDVVELALALQKRGPRIVCLTCGSDGAILAMPEGCRRFRAFAVSAVDTTAAGDAFNGALAVALAEGQRPEEAVRFASAAGALSVTRAGAQPSLPGRREIETFLQEYASNLD